MSARARFPQQFGTPEVGMSRYFALYLAQAGWLVLGFYLLANAAWPSSCRPDTVVKFVTCSIRLPENRGWVEAALMTWLWSTPMLVALELSRRLRKPKRR
jgi:hypothetical protein